MFPGSLNSTSGYEHVLEDQSDEFVDFQFVNYKQAVVPKKTKIEFWDIFMYHFIDASKSKAPKKILNLPNSNSKTHTIMNKDIGVFYRRGIYI